VKLVRKSAMSCEEQFSQNNDYIYLNDIIKHTIAFADVTQTAGLA
jgi:hypothetical protein